MTPADHANTVRHALEEQVFGSVYRKEVMAHLDALQAEAETAEAERDRLADALRRCHDEAGGKTGSTVRDIARAALARTEQP